MAKRVTKLKAAAEAAPQTREEVSRDIRTLGDIQREALRLETAMNDEVAEITARYTPQIENLKKEIKVLLRGFRTGKTNRDELTNGGKTKTANLTTGTVSWRLGNPSCSVSRDVEGVIEMLRRMGLERFIRTKEEVNKEAVLAEPDAVKGIAGIKVNKGAESFYVEPFEQDAGLNK
ncbi:host-nuclease inhibitor Gam family protein [Escherichia coli]|nr:host-nuclease inhibitor Gam family protein [Escherichia coli]